MCGAVERTDVEDGLFDVVDDNNVDNDEDNEDSHDVRAFPRCVAPPTVTLTNTPIFITH